MVAARLLVAVAFLLSVPAGQAAWGMGGHDAARTSHGDGAGPPTDDVAFVVELPGYRGPTLVRDGKAFVVTQDRGQGGQENALWSVDLDTAEVARVVALEVQATAIALHEGAFYVWGNGSLQRLDMAGAAVWRWEPPRSQAEGSVRCEFVAEGPRLYAACVELALSVTIPPLPPRPENAVQHGFVTAHALRAEDGALEWSWSKSINDDEELVAPLGNDLVGPAHWSVRAANLAVGHGIVAVYGAESEVQFAGGYVPRARNSLWVLDQEEGSSLWSANDTAFGVGTTTEPTVRASGSWPVLSDTAIVARLDGVQAFNPRRQVQLWSADVGQDDVRRTGGSFGLGYADGAVLSTSMQSIYALDGRTGAVRWQYALDPEGNHTFGSIPVASVGPMVLGTSFSPVGSDGYRIHAVEAASGRPLWTKPVQARSLGVAADGDHAVLVHTLNATAHVTVLGPSRAALAPTAQASATYPGVGEAVRIEVAAAGPLGPATRYRVDWGDGQATSWHRSATFAHAYATAGDRVVRVQAANDGGQTASVFLTLHVGGVEPNLLSTAFAPENQEVTFFLLGLVVTVLGGVLGFMRLRRRLRILQRELERINLTYESTRSRVADCERALAERRAYVRVLLEDGKLDEAKFAVLEKRIDELLRGLRTGVLDESFDFLPRGMARRLEQMLADGRVSLWEREHFALALREDRLLTAAQKRKVEGLVESWFRHDA